ncbi:afadin- and alpha-actinin-binding protein A isoform X2 [Nelusetta ayraudi]|uniref:afadin- and alpha-actinin-binding protein A isoform X2 n=1 Tax=Nelusetta ayraudi TaxID=303726 RepID=UPI003F70FB6B
MLRCEQTKVTCLQLRCSQQEAELRRREQHINRLKERLADRFKERGSSIDVLNFPPGSRGKRELPVKTFCPSSKYVACLRPQLHPSTFQVSSHHRLRLLPACSRCRRGGTGGGGDETALRLMLERREAELREAMKLRHSLTTLLHALRVDMEQALLDVAGAQEEMVGAEKRLDQAEEVLGDHLTGGVVQGWRQVQKRLGVLSQGAGTDHDKLLARLEAELQESQQLVRLQQQLLQHGLASPAVPELADSYYLEEWDRLQERWAELNRQRRTFERERQSFTDAAIRLSHERHDFEQQKASLLKQQYLCNSPLFGMEESILKRGDGTALGLGHTSVSGCLPITPSPTRSGLQQGSVQTPSTPELYSILNLSYQSRSSRMDHQSEMWQTDGVTRSPRSPYYELKFDN